MNAVSGYSNSINNLDNVQIEVLFKKKMMLIERPKHYSDFVFILALGIIILLAGLASSFSPYTCLQFSSSRPLHNNIWKSPLAVTIKDISPYNSYVSADLQFVTFKYRPSIKKPIYLRISIAFYAKNKIISTLRKDVKYTFQYLDSPSKASKPYQLFYFNTINFDKLVYNISYKDLPTEAKYLATSTFRDEPSFSKLKLFICSLLSFILIIITAIYIKSFYTRYSGWRIEQKVTLHLLFASILYYFPLFLYIHFTRPSLFNLFLLHSSKSAYTSYLYIYCLIIVNVLSGNYQFTKKKSKLIIIFFVLFLTDIFHKMNPEIARYNYSSEICTNYASFFVFKSFLHFCYYVYFFFVVGQSLSNIDSRYTKKAMIYIVIFFVFLTIMMAAKETTAIFEFLNQGPLYYVVKNVFLAMVPIAMVYFHLPLHKSQNDGLMSGSEDFSSDDQIEMFPQVISID